MPPEGTAHHTNDLAGSTAERRNGINGGDPELVEGEQAVYAGFDLAQAERSAIRWLTLTD